MGRVYCVSLIAKRQCSARYTDFYYRNFSVSFAENFAVCSSAYRVRRGTESQMSHVDTYPPHQTMSLISWQLGILEKTLAVS